MENGKTVTGAPKRKSDEFSDPFLTQEVKIHSSPAQAVFENGYITIIDLNTLQKIGGFRTEMSVDPYSIAVRQ